MREPRKWRVPLFLRCSFACLSWHCSSVEAWSVRPSEHRRALLDRSLLLLPGVVLHPDAAWALQPRNEPLCSTGLFEHFLEYKCTPIGDISDEGIPQDLTVAEVVTTDALLSKLGVSSVSSEAEAAAPSKIKIPK